MSQEGFSDQLIEQFLGISERAMRRLRETYHATGDVVSIPACPGWPCLLDGLDAQVHCTEVNLCEFVGSGRFCGK